MAAKFGTPTVMRRPGPCCWGARVSIEAAPKVAELMARELRRDGDWQKQTVGNFKQLAQGYLLPAMSTDDTPWALS